MGLERYAVEARGHADELLSMLTDEHLSWAKQRRARQGGAWLVHLSPDQIEAAMKFLAKTPAQREKAVDRMDPEAATVLVLQARGLALLGAKAMDLAESLSYIPGRGYREGTVRAATAVLQARLHLDADKILSRS